MLKLILTACLLMPLLLNAKTIQILFTNDIHGNVLQYRTNPELGGYGRIKYLLDLYKTDAQEQGIETITLDAGDFLEGNISYMANNTNSLLDLHNNLGFDAVVVGNHDYLMGTEGLNMLITTTPPTFSLLAANIKFKRRYTELHKTIRPYTILERSGLKIGILGVTTDNKIYTFRIPQAKVSSPIKSANKQAKKLNDNVDFTIALTHLGYATDRQLARESKQIDIIVGGHSHTTLKTPTFINNKNGVPVPIVQAGAAGRYIGRILIDIRPNHENKVLKYELIKTSTIHKDELVESKVQELEEELDHEYGHEWLNEVIGHSTLSNDEYYKSKATWGTYIAETLRASTNSQIGIHASEFSGARFPIGDVTRKEVFNSYPRVFDTENRKGWKVYTFNVYGGLLAPIIKIIYKYNMSVYLAGTTFSYKKKKDGNLSIKKIYVNGKKIKFYKKYSLSVPEGIILGSLGISKFLTKLYAKQVRQTPIYIWEALNDNIANGAGLSNEPLEKQDNSYMILDK